MFVGYEGDSTNYRIYHLETRKIIVSRNVVFHEEFDNLTVSKEKEEGFTVPTTNDSENDAEEEDDENYEEAVEQEELARYSGYELNFIQVHVPETYKEAIEGKDSSRWAEAINEEIAAHKKNNTWTIVPREAGRKRSTRSGYSKSFESKKVTSIDTKLDYVHEVSSNERGLTTRRRFRW